jgi:ceramide glucosyltransferase
MAMAHTLGLLIPSASILYQLVALWSVTRFRRSNVAPSQHPGITVFKPVHGLDAQLYENLRSFCEQDYGVFQIIFCAASEDDAALPTIHRLIAEFPRLDLSLVVCGHRIGSNAKISNVANAAEQARHDLIVIADSDMRVKRNYLTSIAKAFEPDDVGAVTCLYTGSAAGRLASQLGCMYINDVFLPSILVALRMETLKFCFGATMAIRRSVLEAIGGLTQFGNYLADDYMLGKLVSDKGFRVVLAPVVVENVVLEPDIGGLLRHEVRWARTVRTVRPIGYALSILTQTVPLALLALLLCHTGTAGVALLGVAICMRVLIHYAVRHRFGVSGASSPQLIPLREAMNFSVWVTSFLGNNVEWRGSSFAVASDGQMSKNEVAST